MSDKKIIAVVGATGAQGGGIARAILDDPTGPFALRALTRDVNSPAARALAERGAEVVAADLDDEASVRRAFQGAYGAFVVTNFWADRTPEQEAARDRAQMEIDQARTAAAAAKAEGLKHVVWSTLDDSRPVLDFLGSDAPTLMGRFKVPHFDAKAEADAFFREQGVPTTFLQTTMYYESVTGGMKPQRGEDGTLALVMPMGDSTLTLVAVEDIGRTAYGIFLKGSEFIGRTVGIAGEHLTGKELAEILAESAGEPVEYRPLTIEQFRGDGSFPISEAAANIQFYQEADAYFVRTRDIALTRELNPRLVGLREWLRTQPSWV
ncbi:uncharacterized protein YbjT (DUF2867 family) [Crossiella equi]|uniref:Uncharacterized protein YbjT (DUF2867 family) n=1 Tax=Crossiella equi TaxID=130796 RepID=A0ABS5A762_9PSEU|nr:NmrA/HSCARG family protein [Crossiella equi]MBP2472433.1 uncharacterized protein YbjT (DUF2867 family) [Crossiella equi]